ncbi:(-)-germacrene D synthase-like isoform X2 [Magnolia sinica]|uniref:(-)-germacrene D synthase-like isoform X2 n=1 Tax=Magnolia sinica TaxID=86752 RepID=UPI0026581F2F|nr:(-)-germacrene D synthase-like isoform X2 [Magnolia sinica]
MAHQGSPSPCSPLQATEISKPEVAKPEVARPMADYHPSVWGDHFLNYSVDDKKVYAWTKQVEILKEEVSRMLVNAKGSVQEMDLIDDIQRLAIAYHFEKEIDEALHRMYDEYTNVHYDDLYEVALRFRLLRQGGYNVSSDVFNKFKGEDGNFKAILSSDVKGLLSLYEAAYLRIQGEDILDEAIVFTSGLLKRIVAHHHDHPLDAKVRRALELPLHKRIPRLEARYFISLYQEDKSHNDVLLELAILDFNLLQTLHQRELRDLSRWWKDLGLATKYPFARDRLVEAYYWILGVYYEPQYSRARVILTKIFKITSIIDDTYDAYATLDEVEVFTDAIYRWEVEAAEGLPEYMKACYLALLNTVNEIEGQMMPDEKHYRTNWIKSEMKVLVQAYLDEARWMNSKYMPTLKEHLDVSLVSAGYIFVFGVACVGMGEEATKKVFDWMTAHPKFVMDLSVIARIGDDIAGHEFEQERDHVASTVECYMKEHGVSKKEACISLQEMITNVWEDLNEAFLRPTVIPSSLLLRGLNLARVMEDLYVHGDGYTHSNKETKKNVMALLVDPIPIPM